MKKYITLLLLFLLLMPATIFAKTSYTKESLKEVLDEEEIEYDLGDYTESEDKINLYLFRGSGCSHCQEFLEYVANTLVKEEGDKFNLVSFEVWNNQDNSKLMEKVATKLGEDAGGVPFIVIGDKSFSGYSEAMNDNLVSAINEAYEAEERYDILDVLGDDKESETKKDNSSIVLLIVVAIAGIVVLVVTGLKKEN